MLLFRTASRYLGDGEQRRRLRLTEVSGRLRWHRLPGG